MRFTYWIVCPFAALFCAAGARCAETAVSFDRDIRPILAATCFACHGPDEEAREADLRLDVRQAAVESGAIVPGEPEQSELLGRVVSDDPEERMPPAGSSEPLTDEQRELIRRWIASGARYDRHWSFIAPSRPPLARVNDSNWPRNALDHFVLARLETAGLSPSPEADRYTLVRRLYLDLIGLPPTPEEADAFASDEDPQAYERLVERLLASNRYGERWARLWLDLARYADTNGYEKDRPRSIWPYRDWVIRALNDDLPFDQFTVEQLAGDMLPQATASQRIATGFHRNTMLNEEGGIDPLEYRFYAMVDRTATTGTVWLGLTTGCAQCHSHKYDPISHTDYYRLMALLNNADEPDLTVEESTVAERRQKVHDQIARLEAALPDHFPPLPGTGPEGERRYQHLEQKLNEWLKTARARAVKWTVLRPHQLTSNLPKLEILEDGSVFSSGDITKRDVFTLTFLLDDLAAPITALRLEVLPDERLPGGGPGRAYYEGRKGDFFISELSARAGGQDIAFTAGSHSYGKISIGSGNASAANVFDGEGSTGWSTAGREGEPHQLVLNLAEPSPPRGELEIQMLFERHFAASLGRFRLSITAAEGQPEATAIPVGIEELLVKDSDCWTAADRARVRCYFLRIAPELNEARKRIDQLRGQLPDYPITMALRERPPDNPRSTNLHYRGEYLSPRDEVTPAIPQIFQENQSGQRLPSNRLEFARWLVSEDNPLVGRVTVNRAWQALFSIGLVHSSGDFGTQSNPPANPELLDWLACELAERGWSMKSLHRAIVSSSTYRQRSHLTPQLIRHDSTNRLLTRAPRFRVAAEMVRDIMLRASGLLSSKMLGPSVYPPQPAAVTALAYGGTKWAASTGEDRFRRSLYTFSKRTAPFAAYAAFDSPSGESCVVRRNRSNTPLQALTLLNDEMFLEMSRALARLAFARQTEGAHACATSIFRRVLTRPPEPHELTALLDYYQSQTRRLAAGHMNPIAIADDEQASVELAAWVMVARAVMNLDEAITKP